MKWLQKLLGIDRIIAHQKHTHALLRWQIEVIVSLHQDGSSKHGGSARFTCGMPRLYEPKEKE